MWFWGLNPRPRLVGRHSNSALRPPALQSGYFHTQAGGSCEGVNTPSEMLTSLISPRRIILHKGRIHGLAQEHKDNYVFLLLSMKFQNRNFGNKPTLG